MPAAEPPAQDTTPKPSMSTFDSPDWENSIKDAIKATEAAALPPALKSIAEVPPVENTAPEVAPKPSDKSPAAPASKDDDEIPQDIKSPAAQSSWKKLKESKGRVEGERDAAKKERDTYKAEIETLRKTAVTPTQQAALADNPEYQQLKKSFEESKKEVETYSEKIRMLDVTQHPKFIDHFNGKISTQHEIAKNIGGDKALEIVKLAPSPYRDQQLEELSAELSPFKAAQLATVLTRLEEINGERSAEISKARDSYAQIQAQQKQQAEQQRDSIQQTYQKVRSEVTDKEKGLTVFQERDGDADWNKGVQERLSLVDKAISGQMQPDEIIRSAYWAAAAPALLQELNGVNARSAAKISELESEISKLRAVSPTPGGTTPGESDTPPVNSKRGMDAYMDSIAAVLPGR
jgi:hypothetical protein